MSLDAGIARRHAHAIPLFFAGVLRGKKQDFSRPLEIVFFGLAVGRRQEDQSRSLLVVAGEVVKILLLGEDVRLGIFFAASEAGEDDGHVRGGGKLGAPLYVYGVGLPFAALLRNGGWRQGKIGPRHQDSRAAARPQEQPAGAHTRVPYTQ